MARVFEDRPAVRERTPLLVGLVGPSGSGKTFSALRLAAGFQRVTGGDIYFIDTEARRALHYADTFNFRHLPFGAPFGSLDYLEAIEHCVRKGAGTIIVDSMSHEHEGPGGVLEQHDAELKRMGGQLSKSMLAWARPKADRRRMINGILQVQCNFVFCFRAKEKLKIQQGRDPVPLGFMPIAGEEFVFEMTMNALLMPGSNGRPTWASDMVGERSIMKLPRQFAAIFEHQPQLTEDVGAAMAEWSAGVQVETFAPAEFVQRYATCPDAATFRTLEASRAAAWGAMSKADKADVKAARDRAEALLRAIDEARPPTMDGDEGEPGVDAAA
jgi:ABC-type dipeptide/oligopeptide/nickel transport system ATPase subunit